MENLVDIITLDNLEQKLPRWDPDNNNHLYALVDMGSNGIRFSISDLSPPRARLLKCIYRERASISLFDALTGPSLVFSEETIKSVSQTLARFKSIAVDSYGVPLNQIRVFATEAMRRAQNATSMLEAIRIASPGLSVHILAPEVETLFGAVGASSSFVNAKGLFLDLGGGSVQMTYLDTSSGMDSNNDTTHEIAAALAGQSLPFGAARLIKLLEDSDVEVQTIAKSELSQGLTRAFQTLCERFPSLAAIAAQVQEGGNGETGSGIDVYLCGGGFRGYGSMLMQNHPISPYPIPSIGSFTVSGELFSKTTTMLKVNKSFDGKIFGMSKRRRAQFPAIVAVVDALIGAVPPIRSVTFCAGGNREGALMMILPTHIRQTNPMTIENEASGFILPASPNSLVSIRDIMDTLHTALPPDMDSTRTATIFSLQLGSFYVRQIWHRLGQDADANASAALHYAVNLPDQPGLTHLSRAVLGVTSCARWGASLAPVDLVLYRNLRALLDSVDPEAVFWADYIGAVSAVLATILPSWPRSQQNISEHVRFQAAAEKGKKYKISLEVFVHERLGIGLNLDELANIFKPVSKWNNGRTVSVVAKELR